MQKFEDNFSTKTAKKRTSSSTLPQQIRHGTEQIEQAARHITRSSIDHAKHDLPRSYSDSSILQQLSTKYTPRRQSARNVSTGSIVQPGIRITREQHIQSQRERQAQSNAPREELSVMDDMTFKHLWGKIVIDLASVFQDSDDRWDSFLASNAISHALSCRAKRHPSSLHSFIITSILFLLIFSASNCMINHLLLLSRASAQCSPLVSYVPVTYTVTSYIAPTSTITSLSQQVSASTQTLTSTSTHTQTVLLSQVSPATTSQYNGGSYYYAVESGTTSWLSNISPSAGVPQVTLTTTIYVTPGSTSTPTTTLDAITVLPPPYVSTTYSLQSPDSTHTVIYTQTLTQTVSDTITRTRSSFTPPGTNGWNSTSTTLDSDSTSLVSGIPTTITGAIYWSTGSRITSTSLTTLTLTLTRAHQSTITVTDSQPASTSSAVETSPLGTSSPSSSQSIGVYSVSLSSTSSAGSAVTSAYTVASSIAAASYGGLSLSSPASTPSGISTSYQISGQTSSTSSSSFWDQAPAMGAPLSSSSSISHTQGGLTSIEKSSSASYAQSQSSSAVTSLVSSLVTGTSALSSSSPSSTNAAPSGSIQSYSSVSASYGGLSSRAVSLPTQTASDSSSFSSQASSSFIASAQSQSSAVPSNTRPYSINSVSIASSTGSTSVQLGVGTSSYTGSASAIVSAPSNSSSAYTSISSAASSTQASLSQVSSSQASSSQSSSVSSYTPSSVTASASTTGNATSSASPSPSVCGEHGNFTLDFDDLPMYTTNKSIDITQAAPIFNGYHHLAWSNGYVYAPPPNDPFPPHSSPHLAVFLGNASGNGSDNTPSAMAPVSGMIGPGEFGDGSSSAVSAFWFDAYSAWLGCDNPGPEPCTYVLTAYVWDPTARREKEIDQQTATTSACPGFQNCQLQEVQFPQTFVNLTGLQIQAYKGPDQVMFFMDDVQLAWSNNTCAAGLRRAQSPRGAPPTKRVRR